MNYDYVDECFVLACDSLPQEPPAAGTLRVVVPDLGEAAVLPVAGMGQIHAGCVSSPSSPSSSAFHLRTVARCVAFPRLWPVHLGGFVTTRLVAMSP
jgi:hypothetical protein